MITTKQARQSKAGIVKPVLVLEGRKKGEESGGKMWKRDQAEVSLAILTFFLVLSVRSVAAYAFK